MSPAILFACTCKFCACVLLCMQIRTC